MARIDQIKELHNQQGLGPSEIAGRLGIDRKTVRKYMAREDFNEEMPLKESHPSKLDRWKKKIDEWLAEDERMRYKQRHTAKRVHERLRKEYGEEYDCSYPLVQRYLKRRKAEGKGDDGALELLWAPGEAQADFGEAVGARAAMSSRIAADGRYGDGFLFSDMDMLGDALAYSASLIHGEDAFNAYVDERYDSSDEYARRYRNWERSGMVGVRAGDPNWFEETWHKSIGAFPRLAGLSDREALSLTESAPTVAQDVFSVGILLLTFGKAAEVSRAAGALPAAVQFAGKAALGVAGIPTNVDEFAQSILERGIYGALGAVDADYTRWHDHPAKDDRIFGMADALGIALAVPYDPSQMDERRAQQIEQQMVHRYYALGNLMFNEGINDPRELQMLMYGAYELVDVQIGQNLDGKLGISVPQFEPTPGYLHQEFRAFWDGDRNWMDREEYRRRIDFFRETNRYLVQNHVRFDSRGPSQMDYVVWERHFSLSFNESEYTQRYNQAFDHFGWYQDLLMRIGAGR